jgi:hypothetical protein
MRKRYLATFLLVTLLFAQALAATVTRNPTSNTTPDPGQGGLAVTDALNTGHGSTAVDAAAGGGSQTKTCIWTSFQSVGGQITAISLKLNWTETGDATDGTNQFLIQYSLNGGGAWTDIINHNNVEDPNSGSSTVTLSAGQDLSQVRVRDKLFAQTGNAVLVGSVDSIRLEVTTQDGTVIVMM